MDYLYATLDKPTSLQCATGNPWIDLGVGNLSPRFYKAQAMNLAFADLAGAINLAVDAGLMSQPKTHLDQ